MTPGRNPMKTVFQIAYLLRGEVLGTTVVDSLEGELADKVLNTSFRFPRDRQPDDFQIIEGSCVPHPRIRGAVIFTAREESK